MYTPSQEQQYIIDSIAKGHNIVVDAVAGSGKTTTILNMAKTFYDRKILQVTYNSQLKSEVREMVKKHDIFNLEVHSYHSLCVKYYDPVCYTDQRMLHVL